MTDYLTDSPPSYSTSNMKTYNMYYTTMYKNVRLCEGKSSTTPTYYLQGKMSLNKPQVLLRRGPDSKAPVVAFSKLGWSQHHFGIGKGDCLSQAQDQLVFEDLQRDKNTLHRSDYSFSTSEGSKSGARNKYTWRKQKNKLLQTVYSAVDEQEQVVARLLSGGFYNLQKGGELEVAEGMDQGLEEMLLISGLAIWIVEAFSYQSVLQGFNDHDKKG